MGNEGSDVGIVGMGCVLPGAKNVDTFWRNVLEGTSFIKELPPSRMAKEVYCSSDDEDRCVSNRAGFVSEEILNQVKKEAKIGEKCNRLQTLALGALHQTLSPLKKTGFQKKVDLVIGCGWPDEDLATYQLLEEEDKVLKFCKNKESSALLSKFFFEKRKKIVDPEVATLTSSALHLMKEAWGLEGESFFVDGACASSLAAVDIAVTKLQCGDADMVITGGIDSFLGPEDACIFSKVGALSEGGCYPFDKKAGGLVQGEGAVLFALERVADAVKNNHQVHAIVKSCGSSSDGRQTSLFSPSSAGQLRAFHRTYDSQNKSINFLECHGTGTVIGDTTELRSVEEFFKTRKHALPIGSVKSLIGHTKATAGAAGMLKCALLMKHKVIPPSPYFTTPIIPIKKVFVNEKSISLENNKVLRCGVSSFGFGGINYHLLMEQAAEKKYTSVSEKNDSIVLIAQSSVDEETAKNYLKTDTFNIPPQSLPQIDSIQLRSLVAVVKALSSNLLSFSHEEKEAISVISASCINLDGMRFLSKKLRLKEIIHQTSEDNVVSEKVVKLMDEFPRITEDSGPGTLNNVIAGRVCNVFNFLGKSFNVDADFNSFLCAVRLARLELQSGKSSIVIVVGSDESLNQGKTHVIRKNTKCLVMTTLHHAKIKGYSIHSIINDPSYTETV